MSKLTGGGNGKDSGSNPGGGNGSGCYNNSGSGNTQGNSSTSPVRHNHLTYNLQHGHSFIKKTFHKPTNCHYCGDLLWGLMVQGYVCEGRAFFIVNLFKCFVVKTSH